MLGKELILINKHRNSIPLLNKKNRDKFVFIDPRYFWKATAVFGRKSKLRYKVIYLLLSFLNPVYIIDINWLSKIKTVYLVWSNNHNRSFIVVQHGIYYAGVMRFIPEKYVKCNIFLVWGSFFKKMFEKNNKGKDYRCIVFGNPVYNNYDRSQFNYKEGHGNQVLIAVSLIKGKRLELLYVLLSKLNEFGFDITVKEHAQQAARSEPITGYKKISGDLYSILEDQEYDIVVTDVSSAMMDIIFFKNRAVYFSPDEEGSTLNENIYSDFLKNLAVDIETIGNKRELLGYIDTEKQEELLNYLIKTEGTSNDLSLINDPRFSGVKKNEERTSFKSVSIS